MLLDASALLALHNDEPGADQVQAAAGDAAMSSVNRAEVFSAVRPAMRTAAFYCLLLLTSCFQIPSAFAESIDQSPILLQVRQVEQDLGAKVGLFLHDLESGEILTHAADDRFPLNSTFKLFACAALLARVDAGESSLASLVDLNREQLLTWSPGVEDILDTGRERATLDELCAAMLTVSDNTAANLILKEIGGPSGFTRYMRSIGDSTTRLDRWEPALNEGLPNDPRDTSTPRAIGKSLTGVLLGEVLTPSSNTKLKDWLSGHAVADDLFRAALPDDWSIHDRTGAGENGTRGIVAVIYPPARAPIVAAMYMRDANVGLAERNAAIARVGLSIVERYGSQ